MTTRNVIKSALGVFWVCLAATTSFSAYATNTVPLPGPNLFPEGIAADNNGGLYIGSLTKGRILYLEPDTHLPRKFNDDGSNGLMSVGGLMVSPDGSTLYVCNSDLGITNFSAAAKPGLVAFGIRDGGLVNRWNFPGGGLCNDMTMTADGTILMTDSFNPRILALKSGADELIEWVTDERFNGEGFNLNGITWNSEGVFVVKYNSNELFRISQNSNGSAGKIEKVQLSRALAGPDGIKALEDGNLLVVEGAGMLSIIKISNLDGHIQTVANGLNVPTTVAVIGKMAYVVEGQLDHLPSPNKAVTAPDPFQLQSITLP